MSNQNKDPIQSHKLDDAGSDFERRFDEEKKRIAAESRVSSTSTPRLDKEPGIFDGIRRKGLAFGVVGATALALTGVSVGKSTLGEGVRSIFPDDSPPVTNPRQLEQQTQDNGGQLPTNQR